MHRQIVRSVVSVSAIVAAFGIVVSPGIRSANAQTSAVLIKGFQFQPQSLTVPVGATVTWTNQDTVAHTSTSDATDAVQWNSGAIASGHSFSFTFSRAGTYTYHCMIHPFMTASILVQSAGTTAPTVTATAPTSLAVPTSTPVFLSAYPVGAQNGTGPIMGTARSLPQLTWQGYYDSHKDTYLNTDVSTRAMAAAMKINYSPGLAHASMGSTAPMYLIEGRAAANQIAVFGSQPGEADYSPLWHEIIVRWKANAHPVLLTSDNQILALQKSGKVTLQTNHVILNCPIIKVQKG